MKKLVVVINGKGGAGKDTLCGFVAKHYPTENVSSITPVKEIAALCGWSGEKDAKSRKFLADLKRLLTWYNDLPTQYLMAQYEKFDQSSQKILFVQIRERDQIEQFRRKMSGRCVTLLVRRDCDAQPFGNAADDEVEDFRYDYIYENFKPLLEAEADFLCFFKKILRDAALEQPEDIHVV